MFAEHRYNLKMCIGKAGDRKKRESCVVSIFLVEKTQICVREESGDIVFMCTYFQS